MQNCLIMPRNYMTRKVNIKCFHKKFKIVMAIIFSVTIILCIFKILVNIIILKHDPITLLKRCLS